MRKKKIEQGQNKKKKKPKNLSGTQLEYLDVCCWAHFQKA